MKGYSISSLTPCSISTSSVRSSFTSLETMIQHLIENHEPSCWVKVRVIIGQTYLILGHSSQTTSCVIWKRPGPSCVVLISCRQLHFLLPGASFATGLFRTTYVLKKRGNTGKTGKAKGDYCTLPCDYVHCQTKTYKRTQKVWILQYIRKEMERDQEQKETYLHKIPWIHLF